MLEAPQFFFRKTLLHDDAVLTHVVTQQGRDHLVKIRRECIRQHPWPRPATSIVTR